MEKKIGLLVKTELWQQVKIAAAKEGITIKEWIERLIQEKLKGGLAK